MRRMTRARHSAYRASVDSPTRAGPGPAGKEWEPRLEELVSWTCREWLRCLWYQARIEISDMNYAARRMVELQMRLPP